MKTADQGIDIGVDTSAANRRSVAKQKARTVEVKKRAWRTGILAKRNRKAKRLALTGVAPSQKYGHTAVGMAPSNVDKCKANIAVATGCMSAGACSTAAIKWSFRRSNTSRDTADPRVSMPLEQLRSWMRIWGKASAGPTNLFNGNVEPHFQSSLQNKKQMETR